MAKKNVKKTSETWTEESGKGEIWDFQTIKPGDSVSGILSRIFRFTNSEGRQRLGFELRGDESTRTVFANSVLERIIPAIPVGSKIRITFLGTISTKIKGRKPARNFKVERDTSYISETVSDDLPY